MKELYIETGLETFRLNDAAEVTFNPTDAAFVETLYKTFDTLDRKQAEYEAEVKDAEKAEIFDVARQRDTEMREMIDAALGAGVSAKLFGSMNVYAMANGLPVWANLLLAVMDEIDTAFVREQKATNPRLEQYLKKYKK